MFTSIIVRPIFNLLVFIYAVLPGHDFGLAIIIFTIVVRLLMWPLVKKQLKQAKAMRELQPEIKRIKKATKGNKQKESQMIMELYKEREVSPFGSIGTLIIQLIVLIGLYSGLRKVVYNPQQIVNFSYPFLQHFGWIKHLAGNIHGFNDTLFGFVDLVSTGQQWLLSWGVPSYNSSRVNNCYQLTRTLVNFVTFSKTPARAVLLTNLK
jgi:YidC/Oxa1 family membrane protein insertase